MTILQMANPMKQIIAGAKKTLKKMLGGRRTRKAGRRHRRR